MHLDGLIPLVNHRTLTFPTSLAPSPNVHQNYQESFLKIAVTIPYTKPFEPNLQKLGPMKIAQSNVRAIISTRLLVEVRFF